MALPPLSLDCITVSQAATAAGISATSALDVPLVDLMAVARQPLKKHLVSFTGIDESIYGGGVDLCDLTDELVLEVADDGDGPYIKGEGLFVINRLTMFMNPGKVKYIQVNESYLSTLGLLDDEKAAPQKWVEYYKVA